MKRSYEKKHPYRGIVIGCGTIGVQWTADKERVAPRTHAEALLTHPKTFLAALVDSDPARLKSGGKIFPDAHLYNNAKDAVRIEKPDIAVIATPPRTHVPLVKLLSGLGVKMIICEKPLAPSAAMARSLPSALEESRSVFVLNFQRRFYPLFEEARKEIAQGALGKIQQISAYYDNGLYNTGAHALDAILFLLNDRITKASGRHNNNVTTHPEGDPDIDGILESERGTRIALQGFDKKTYGIWELHIFGTEGSLVIREHGHSFEWRVPVRKANIPILIKNRVSRHLESFTKGALEEAIRCYEKRQESRSGISNGIETLLVLDALTKSAKQDGKAVPVLYSA